MAKRAGGTGWMPITSSDGSRQGEYQVSDGMLTVRYEGKTKVTRASSTGVPTEHGANADRSLARVILMEPFP